MVVTRNGTETFPPQLAMDVASPTTPGASCVPTMMEKAKATENARLANETWFNKFSDGPILDELMNNFDAWNVYLLEVTTEKNCKEMLTQDPGNDLIRKNHAKNI